MRAISMLCLASALAAPVAAHDFWLQPERFLVAPADAVPVVVQVGHGTDRQRWGGGAKRVVRFDVHGPKGRSDARAMLTLGDAAADATLRLATAGTYMIVMETNHAGSELNFVRFNDYARDEGLTPILAARRRAGSTGTTGREIYSRRAKALVQVGDTRSTSVTRPVGLTLEIVPQINPYALAANAAFPVQVLYGGKPLAGATIKLNNLDFDAKPLAIKLTDRTGRAAFDVPRNGRWQLNVVWSKPVVGNPAADFDTTFSSLAFGWR